jgi:hypothetical protein
MLQVAGSAKQKYSPQKAATREQVRAQQKQDTIKWPQKKQSDTEPEVYMFVKAFDVSCFSMSSY